MEKSWFATLVGFSVWDEIMANPQRENGFTAIANELYDAIVRWHFSSYEFRILIFIIRKTYGWNKKSDWISLSQFNQATNIPVPHICRALKMLVLQNVITKGGNRVSPKYGIQKDYELWKPLPKGVRSHHKLKGVDAKGVIQLLPKGADTKETITKDNILSPLKGRKEHKPIKPNKPMKYNENEHQDEGLAEIEINTGVVSTPRGNIKDSPNMLTEYKKLLTWAEEKRGRKFTNYLKQMAALKRMRLAGIKGKEIIEVWGELEEDKFWSHRGFDFMDIANHFDKRNVKTN